MSDEKDIDALAGMSDEEFLNEAIAAEAAEDSSGSQEEIEQDEPKGGILEDMLDNPKPEEDPSPTQETASEEEVQTEDGAKPPAGSETDDDAAVSEDPDHTTPKQSTPSKEEGKQETPAADAENGDDKTKSQDGEPDYKALYEQVMTPFKANGKDFAPQSPDEAVRLMQMGANYTKKMQALKPNLRLMRMLENNDLLHEDRISFLIDLQNKNPEAIRKLLHDSKIDPLEIDTSEAPTYKPGNHSVSDEEMSFQDTVTDVASTDTGKETIAHIQKDWDAASKEVIYKEPEVLAVINNQRASGVYDIIHAEIERQRMLGNLTNVPFLHAYKQVGDRLQSEGKLGGQGDPAQAQDTTPKQETQVIESRADVPKQQMANGDKAKAAASGPTAPKSKPKDFDPFAMSDEEIMALPAPH